MRSEKMAGILAGLLLLLTIFLVVAVPVIGLGIALGYGLRAVIPGLDLGWAMVAGAVFAVGIADMAARLLRATQKMEQSDGEEVALTEEPWFVIHRGFFSPGGGSRRQRKRR
jgi:uncharacterized membrane protein YedE/YeeE